MYVLAPSASWISTSCISGPPQVSEADILPSHSAERNSSPWHWPPLGVHPVGGVPRRPCPGPLFRRPGHSATAVRVNIWKLPRPSNRTWAPFLESSLGPAVTRPQKSEPGHYPDTTPGQRMHLPPLRDFGLPSDFT